MRAPSNTGLNVDALFVRGHNNGNGCNENIIYVVIIFLENILLGATCSQTFGNRSGGRIL